MGLPDYELMEVSQEQEFLKNYQAVYNAMTAKPDCRSKAYPRNVIVDIQDIFELNDRIFNKFKNQYDNAGFSCNILVSLKGREKIEFPNWKSFEEHNWIESSIITGMILVWEFNVILPKFKLPQKHTLTVKLSNGIKVEEMLNLVISGKLEEVDEIDQNICPIVAKMDFIDVIIGNEVLGIVSEWVKGLKSSDNVKGKLMISLQKSKHIVAYAITYITLLMSIVCSSQIICKLIDSYGVATIGELSVKNAIEIINVLLGCSIISFILYRIARISMKYTFKVLADYGNDHIFDITKGDKNQQETYRKDERKDKCKIVMNILSTIVVNIVCGIITYFITMGM